MLGNIPGTQIFHNINQYKEALRVPSFLILAVESPIYFANSTYLRERLDKEISRMLICLVQYIFLLSESVIHMIKSFSCCRILRWVREEEERIKEYNGTSLQCIILDMTGTNFIRLTTLVRV